jgi:ABC-type nitrate/sulfonate/bicarbonate transport system substrate-binding protein
MKQIILIIIAIVMVGNTAYAETYKIGTTLWIGFSPTNIADAKGFWKAQGLDVEVITYKNPIEMNNAFTYKRLDIVAGMIGSRVGGCTLKEYRSRLSPNWTGPMAAIKSL